MISKFWYLIVEINPGMLTKLDSLATVAASSSAQWLGAQKPQGLDQMSQFIFQTQPILKISYNLGLPPAPRNNHKWRFLGIPY